MVDGVKGSREIKQTEADDLLTTNGIDKVIMNGKEYSFGWVKFPVRRLEWIKKLITNPPQLLNPLLDKYDTFHSLLDKHAPVRHYQPIYSPQSFSAMFTESLRTARRACRQTESTYRSTHSSSDHSIFMSLRNQYHKLVLAAKRAYYSFMVKSSSDCPRRQWNTINNILHRKSSNLLPSSVSLSVLASQFATLFKEKISTPPDTVHQPSSGSSLSSTSRLQHPSSCNWRWNTQTDSWSSQQTMWSRCLPNITSQALLLCPYPHHHSHSQPESCCWWVSPSAETVHHHSPSQETLSGQRKSF